MAGTRGGRRHRRSVSRLLRDRREGRPAGAGFDAIAEFPPHRHRAVWMNAQTAGLDPGFAGVVTSYRAQVIQSLKRDAGGRTTLRCVFPSWDNTARQGKRGTVFVGSSPELFGYWVEAMVQDTRRRLRGDERLLFVNAWNEWAEGCCLEPDARYGTQYLEALAAGLGSGARLPIVPQDRPAFTDVEREAQDAMDAGELSVERFGATPPRDVSGVSVVMPVYNHERFLDRTLASVAAQTLAPCELVAVDDGSSDGSAAAIERFARSAPFPVTLVRQRNRGAHVALNRGLALARGRTVALLNSDDEFHPQRLERMVATLGDDAGFAFSDAELIDDDDRPARGDHAAKLREATARANARRRSSSRCSTATSRSRPATSCSGARWPTRSAASRRSRSATTGTTSSRRRATRGSCAFRSPSTATGCTAGTRCRRAHLPG
ncbi:MAG: glycoside hydrolase family 99-like domain-containing protein [Betaproteobacteria bacterium]|nr:glycoside hydrolase family 99-like domain-containing protein [Betaproteobacteria bacterium]